PECKGICPTCGADLNAGDCACQEETVEPRWAGLAALKSRLDSER
ncbi:MAG: YceD family protein, partial [Thermoanaerobaculia bacterium]